MEAFGSQGRGLWRQENIGEINEYVFAVEVKKTLQIKLSKEHTEFKWGTKSEIKDIYEMPENKVAIEKI